MPLGLWEALVEWEWEHCWCRWFTNVTNVVWHSVQFMWMQKAMLAWRKSLCLWQSSFFLWLVLRWVLTSLPTPDLHHSNTIVSAAHNQSPRLFTCTDTKSHWAFSLIASLENECPAEFGHIKSESASCLRNLSLGLSYTVCLHNRTQHIALILYLEMIIRIGFSAVFHFPLFCGCHSCCGPTVICSWCFVWGLCWACTSDGVAPSLDWYLVNVDCHQPRCGGTCEHL